MYINRMKMFLFGVAAGLLALTGTVAASFPAMAGTVAVETQKSAETDIKAIYWIYNNGTDWSVAAKDNTYVQAPKGSYATAIWASLENQPAGMTGTIEYQVNLSGFGWKDWQEHSTEAGNSAGSQPLEAVRVKLTGDVGKQYDVYYSVLQNGGWTELVMNGETAGTEGQGLRVEGLRVAIRKKGTGLPEEAKPAVIMAHIDPAKPMVALTFDDGPSNVTPRILDSLEANGARATFYMVGNRMGGYQDTIRRMQAIGCELGSHTWNHTYLTRLSASGIHGNLNQFDTTLQTIAGVRSVTMRPPGGYFSAASGQALASYGVPAIMWSIDTLDWKTKRAQSTIDCVLTQVRDGSIILMHDLYGATADAAAVLIPELINRGYQLVTVSELAAHRGGMQPGQVYHSFYP